MKIGFVSLGCPKNLVDSEVMLGLAERAGHEVTERAEGADVIVVNTCAFIDKAKEESVETILEMARHKRDGACRHLIVTGCLAERYRDELRKEMSEIDAVLGTDEVPDIVGALDGQPRPTRVPVPLLRGPVEAATQIAATEVPLRRRHAEAPYDCPASGLREGRGRLRLCVRVLHHSDAARRLPQPAGRLDRGGSSSDGGARREGADPHFAGLDDVRTGS